MIRKIEIIILITFLDRAFFTVLNIEQELKYYSNNPISYKSKSSEQKNIKNKKEREVFDFLQELILHYIIVIVEKLSNRLKKFDKACYVSIMSNLSNYVFNF